jgi:hypothetical protein
MNECMYGWMDGCINQLTIRSEQQAGNYIDCRHYTGEFIDGW